MRKAILLMLFCCSANAAMYTCVDESVNKVLRNYPCEQNEKQQTMAIKAEPSYYVINSIGVRNYFGSSQTIQSPPVARVGNAITPFSDANGWDPQLARIAATNAAMVANLEYGAKSGAYAYRSSDDGFEAPPPQHFNSEPDFSIPTPPPIEPDFKQSPSRITNCDLAGCRDDIGNRHNYLGGDMLSNPGGNGNCRLVGDKLRCP